MIPQIEMSVLTSNVKHVCMTIEGEHDGVSFESSHTISVEDIKDYLSEFFEAYAENPKSAKFMLFHCDCSRCEA